MRVAEALRGISSLLLDTAPAIYHLERHPRYAGLLDRFFQIREARGIEIITSPVTLAECLVLPLRLGRADLASSYRELLLSGDSTTFHLLGDEEALVAAEVRAQHNLRLPDAFQVAVARTAGCQAILTNDAAFRRVGEPRILFLDDLQP